MNSGGKNSTAEMAKAFSRLCPASSRSMGVAQMLLLNQMGRQL
jgi:hypothetical protein